MADIFISYASEDRSRIEPLAISLEEQGWSVFWDRTIPAGKTWRQVIGDALKNARSVIVAWSTTSVESRWVHEEAERGLNRNVLIPIFIDDVEPPLGFGSIQAADLIAWKPRQSSPEFDKLLTAISALLGPSPTKVKKAEQAAEAERNREQEEKRMLREADAVRKAEEEARRKEADEEAERARKAEAQRRAEEERKFKQRLPENAGTRHSQAEKAAVRHLATERKEDKGIAAAPTRELWVPILLTTFGWAMSGAIYGAYSGGAGRFIGISSYIDSLILLAISGAIGGLVTVIALRQILPGIQRKQGFFVTIGWAISWAISRYVIGGDTIQDISNAIGWVIGLAIVDAIQWAIAGALGSGVMFLLLDQAKRRG